MRTHSLAALVFAAALPAHAKTPAAPSDLKVKALGVNAFKLDWKDNSKNETGFEIRIGFTGGPIERYTLLPRPGATTYIVTTQALPGRKLSFQLSAYNGETGAEKFSKLTPPVSATAYKEITFEKPEKFRVKVLDDGRLKLAWQDKSTSENGYEIQLRTGASKEWLDLGRTDPGKRFRVPVSGFAPATKYTFRVRAFRAGDPQENTGWSKKVRATTEPLRAPAALVATASGSGAFIFKWQDHSSAESGFELQSQFGNNPFVVVGTVGPNFTSTTPIASFIPGLTYNFRIRAFHGTGDTASFSGFSNTVTGTAP